MTFALRNCDIPEILGAVCPHPETTAMVPAEYVFLLEIQTGCFEESKLIGVDNCNNAISFFFVSLLKLGCTIFRLTDFRCASLFKFV